MSGPLKIAIDARVLGQRGVGRYLANVLRALAARRDEARYLLCLGPRSERALVPKDKRFEAVDLGHLHPAWAEQAAIPRLAKAWGADVIHYPDNSGAVFAGLPTVLTLHDTMWRRPLGDAIASPTLRQRLQDAYRKAVCPAAARRATRVLTISSHSAACLRDELGLLSPQVVVVPESVDPIFCRPLAPKAAAALRRGLGLTRPYVLASGAADRRKNIDRLIEAFALARLRDESLRDAVLTVTSLRPGEAATTTYAQTARRAGVEGDVVFLGYVSDGQMKALYQGALCYAFPSLWEGFGLPMLEAYSLACPVLAAQGSALSETAGLGAVMVDGTDVEALAQGLSLACSAKGRRERIRRGRVQLKKFTWKACAAGHWKAYKEAAQKA